MESCLESMTVFWANHPVGWDTAYMELLPICCWQESRKKMKELDGGNAWRHMDIAAAPSVAHGWTQ